MQTKGRALFNLLRMNWLEDSQIAVEPWQVQNYRELSMEKLFQMLEEFKISLTQERFVEYASECDSPEELTETLCLEEDLAQHDKVFLVVFELWRRLQPSKQSLSVFCDEFDNLIELYDREELLSDEPLQEAFADLERILDQSVDRGQNPKEVFEAFSEYCAHDLETFIFDYAHEQIDLGNTALASELIDGFSPYISDDKWFCFLRATLLFDIDEEEAVIMIEGLLERLQEEPDLDLLLEMARFVASRGLRQYFFRTAMEAQSHIEEEGDFQELLALSCEFLRVLNSVDLHEELMSMLQRRQANAPEKQINTNDRDLSTYFSLMSNLQRSEV